VAGDVTKETAAAAVKREFADWKAEGPKPTPSIVTLPEVPATHIYLVDRPGSVQSQIRLGHRSINRKDEEYFNGVVLSQIFGGSFSSRLNKAIRVEKGLTYGARGGISPQRFTGTFSVSTFTKTPTTAETLELIREEIRKIRDSSVSSEELNNARSYLVGSFAGNRETPDQTVGDLWLIEYADLPKDYLSRYLKGVGSSSIEDVQRAAQRLIQPERLTIVVVGEAEVVKADLEKIAPVTVVQSAPEEPKPPSAMETKPPT
jgi:zinc protease